MHRGYRISITLLVVGIVGFLFWYSAHVSVETVAQNEHAGTVLGDEEGIIAEIGADEEEMSTPTQPILELQSGTHEVIFTESGFSPKISTINVGDTIIFKNESKNNFSPASNPHPAHTDLRNFVAKKILKPGQTFTFTFLRPGTWRYHDELAPDQGGTVIVLK